MAAFTARIGGRVGTIKRVAGIGKVIRPDAIAILKRYTSFTKAVQAAGPFITKAAMQPAFDLSQVYVPKDTLALMKSGYLKVTRRSKNHTVQMGYGFGGTPHYAGIVHEVLEFKHESPTRAKYLTEALNQTQAEAINIIRERYSV